MRARDRSTVGQLLLDGVQHGPVDVELVRCDHDIDLGHHAVLSHDIDLDDLDDLVGGGIEAGLVGEDLEAGRVALEVRRVADLAVAAEFGVMHGVGTTELGLHVGNRTERCSRGARPAPRRLGP